MSHSLTSAESRRGLLLIGHGTRDPCGLAEFANVVHQVATQMAPIPVEAAFLELATPTIPDGVNRLVARGATKIVVAPLLLFAAGHAKKDIPAAVEAAIRQHPGVAWQPADHLGHHPALLDLSARRFREVAQIHHIDADHGSLIVVGRGSHDAEATRDMLHYAELLAARVGVRDMQVSFLAMAQPRLPEILAQAAASTSPVIFVQPHLLFHGELLEDVQRQVAEWRSRLATKQWLVTGHLGPEPEVVAAIVERCQAAI